MGEGLHLGSLSGNHFRLLMRNVVAPGGQEEVGDGGGTMVVEGWVLGLVSWVVGLAEVGCGALRIARTYLLGHMMIQGRRR